MATPPITRIVGFRFERRDETGNKMVATDKAPGTECTGCAEWKIMHGYCFNDETSQRGYGELFAYVRNWDPHQRLGRGLSGGFVKKVPCDRGGTSEKIDSWGNCEGHPLRIARFTDGPQKNYLEIWAFFDDIRPAPVLGFWKQPAGKGAELVKGVEEGGVRHAWGSHIGTWSRPTDFEVCLAESIREEVLAINFITQQESRSVLAEISVSTHEVNNQSDDPLQRTVSEAVSLRNTATIMWEGGVKIGGEATIKAGVPFFVDGDIKSTLELHASHSREYTNETIRTLALTDETTVKPRSAKRCIITSQPTKHQMPSVATVRHYYRDLGYLDHTVEGTLTTVLHNDTKTKWEDITTPTLVGVSTGSVS